MRRLIGVLVLVLGLGVACTPPPYHCPAGKHLVGVWPHLMCA